MAALLCPVHTCSLVWVPGMKGEGRERGQEDNQEGEEQEWEDDETFLL